MQPSDESALLDDRERSTLLKFLGFGNPKAPYAFVGMEEGLTETADYPLLAQLKDRAKLPAIVDLHESAVHPEKYLSGDRPPIQSTWAPLVAILLALSGNMSPTNDEVRAYQRDRLGRSDGDSLLLEFLPLPVKGLGSWSPYDQYFPNFPDRDMYFEAMRWDRIAALRSELVGRSLVVCYGSKYWGEYRSLLPSVSRWESRGIFEYARTESGAALLMPHPVSRQMNGQRHALCELARELTTVSQKT